MKSLNRVKGGPNFWTDGLSGFCLSGFSGHPGNSAMPTVLTMRAKIREIISYLHLSVTLIYAIVTLTNVYDSGYLRIMPQIARSRDPYMLFLLAENLETLNFTSTLSGRSSMMFPFFKKFGFKEAEGETRIAEAYTNWKLPSSDPTSVFPRDVLRPQYADSVGCLALRRIGARHHIGVLPGREWV